VLYAAGAVARAINGSVAGWILCAVGLAGPLAFHEDQLTQSAYLLACAVGAVGCWLGRAEGRSERTARALPGIVRWLTVGTYGFAAIHKLNRDFFDPAASCATGGVRILADNWAAPFLAEPSMAPVWPVVFVSAELLLVVLLVVRPAAGIGAALLMHIPLTIVFAPSFAFVMMTGWVCLLTEDDLAHLGRVMRHRWPWILGLGGALGLGSFALYMQRHWVVYPWWSLKEGLLWIGAVWVAFAWHRRPPGAFGWWSGFRERIPRGRRAFAAVMLGAWILNGLTPYTGLQLHHTGAMLSNLRVDRGCWNSLLFPEALRIVDPHVRVEAVEIGGDVAGRRVLRAEILGTLWNRASLRDARTGWCEAGAGPIRLRATYDGDGYEIRDLCSEWPFGDPLLPGFRAHQTNLAVECPQSCIH